MKNEKKINKTFSNTFKKNKLDISNNSEDFEFVNIKEYTQNKSAKSFKYKNIKKKLYESQNQLMSNEEFSKENMQLKEDNIKNNQLEDIKNDENNNSQISDNYKKEKNETERKYED